MGRRSISVSLPETLIWQLDQFTQQAGLSRSCVIERLIETAPWSAALEEGADDA